MDASSLIHILIQLIVVGLIVWLLWWLIGYIGLPEPFNKIARVIIAVIAVLFLVNLMLGFAGTPLVRWR
jgi:Zn-dependent protease with chaperone function